MRKPARRCCTIRAGKPKNLQSLLPDAHGVWNAGRQSVRGVGRPRLIEKGVERLIVLPMYPQYSATTTASATDVLFQALLKEKRVPALRIVPPYYAHPAYLDAMTTVIREELKRLPWTPDHYILSFHGIPIRYAQQGDPYATHVKRTTAELVKRLGWPHGQWTQTFQSLFGREEWLKPYTEETLKQLAKKGARACSWRCRVSQRIAWRPSTKSAARRPKRFNTPAARCFIAVRASTIIRSGSKRCGALLRKRGRGGCSQWYDDRIDTPL